MNALLPLAQVEMKWDAGALKFSCRLLWNDDRESWYFFSDAPPAPGQYAVTQVRGSTAHLMLHQNEHQNEPACFCTAAPAAQLLATRLLPDELSETVLASESPQAEPPHLNLPTCTVCVSACLRVTNTQERGWWGLCKL